jgi:hypothetical protein
MVVLLVLFNTKQCVNTSIACSRKVTRLRLFYLNVIIERKTFYSFHAAIMLLFHILEKVVFKNLHIRGRDLAHKIKFRTFHDSSVVLA